MACQNCKGGLVMTILPSDAPPGSYFRLFGITGPRVEFRICDCILARLLPDETNLPLIDARDTERPGPLLEVE